jgi:hypothetical protein
MSFAQKDRYTVHTTDIDFICVLRPLSSATILRKLQLPKTYHPTSVHPQVRRALKTRVSKDPVSFFVILPTPVGVPKKWQYGGGQLIKPGNTDTFLAYSYTV